MRSAGCVLRTDYFAQDFECPAVFARRLQEFLGVVIAECYIGDSVKSDIFAFICLTVDENAAFDADLPLIS